MCPGLLERTNLADVSFTQRSLENDNIRTSEAYLYLTRDFEIV